MTTAVVSVAAVAVSAAGVATVTKIVLDLLKEEEPRHLVNCYFEDEEFITRDSGWMVSENPISPSGTLRPMIDDGVGEMNNRTDDCVVDNPNMWL